MGASSSSPRHRLNQKPVSRREAESVSGLVQRLAARALAEEGAENGQHVGDVILDVEMEGVRCILLRAETETLGRATFQLSPRESEIARMVALGYPNKAIAAVLDISTWTVGSHLRRIFAKLQVPSRAAMVARLAEGKGLSSELR